VSTGKDPREAKLRELTRKRKAGEEAKKEARQIVRQLLREGWSVSDLVDMPFSRAEIYSIRRGLQDAGELPAD
jgi:hypothetical protein